MQLLTNTKLSITQFLDRELKNNCHELIELLSKALSYPEYDELRPLLERIDYDYAEQMILEEGYHVTLINCYWHVQGTTSLTAPYESREQAIDEFYTSQNWEPEYDHANDHWIVSDRLFAKLQTYGDPVLNYKGLPIWANFLTDINLEYMAVFKLIYRDYLNDPEWD